MVDLKDKQITFLSGVSRIPEKHITALRTAQRLATPDLPVEVFYALQQQGLPTDLDQLYSHSPQNLRTALEAAIQKNVISIINQQTLEQWCQRLESRILNQAISTACQDQPTSMGKLLTSVEPDSSLRRRIIQSLLTLQRIEPTRPLDAFWPKIEADLHLGLPKIKALRFALQVGQITRNTLPLVSSLQTLHEQGQILSAIDLALWHTQDWAEWLQTIADTDLPAWADGDTSDAKRDSLADFLHQQAAAVFPTTTTNQSLISGRILTSTGRPVPHVRVQAFHQEFAADQPTPIGSAVKTRVDGSYQIVLDPFQLAQHLSTAPAALSPLHLHISATRANQEQEPKRSDVQYNLTLPVTIDLTMEGEPEPTEFEQVRDRIHQAIGLASDLSNLQPEKLTWLAGVTRIDPKTLERFTEAHRLSTQAATEQSPSLSPEVHYALLHPIAQKVSQESISATQSLEAAIAAGIVAPTVQDSVQDAASWLQERARQQEIQTRLEHLRSSASQLPGASLKEILTAVDLPEAEFSHYTQILAEEPDVKPEQIEHRLQEKGVSVRGRAIIRRTQRLTQIVGAEDDLVKHLVAEMPPLSGLEGISSKDQDEAKLRTFAQNDTDDWQGWLATKQIRQRIPVRPIQSLNSTTADQPSLRLQARHLAANFEKVYPTEALLGRLKKVSTQPEQVPNPANFVALKNFVEAQINQADLNQAINLHGPGLKLQLLRLNRANGVSGNGEAAQERSVLYDFVRSQEPEADATLLQEKATRLEKDLTSLQRLLRIAPCSEAVHLLSQGHTSARSIATMSQESFVQQMVEAGKPADEQDRAFLQEQAKVIHRRAARQFSKALAIATTLSPQLQQISPSAVSGLGAGRKKPASGNAGGAGSTGSGTETHPNPPELPEGANLESLFGPQTSCLAPPSQSVLGTGAYLVDLLEMLKNNGGVPNVQEVLLKRRPDIAELELSAANAETPVPYIDLVIELLEQKVTSVPDYYPQTTWTAEELAALPEHLNSRAYDTLANAVFPWSLPFNFTQAETAIYLADLGLSRDKLIRCFRSQSLANQHRQTILDSTLAYLGLSTTERQIITAVLEVRLCLQIDPAILLPRLVPQLIDGFEPNSGDLILIRNSSTKALFLARIEGNPQNNLALRLIRKLKMGQVVTVREGENYGGMAWMTGFDHPWQGQFSLSATINDSWRYWGYYFRPDRWPQCEGKNVRTFLNKSGLEYSDLMELLTADYINPQLSDPPGSHQVTLHITGDGCNLSKMNLEGVDEPFLNRFHRFVRLWRRLGWTVRDLDRAIKIFQATDLTDNFLIQVVAVKRLAERLNLAVTTVLTFWGDLDTQATYDRTSNPAQLIASQYDQIFQDKTRLSEDDRRLLAIPLTASFADVKVAVWSALGLSAEDLALLINETTQLNLNTLSKLYRWATLSKAVHWSIKDLLRLQTMSGLDDPWINPEATQHFLDAVEQVRSSNFNLHDLDILLCHQTNPEFEQKLEKDAIALFENLTKRLTENAPCESREEKIIVLARLLAQATPTDNGVQSQLADHIPHATRIIEILEGTGVCMLSPDQEGYLEAHGVELTPDHSNSEPTRLTVAEVGVCLQGIANVLTYNPETLTAQLVGFGTPESAPGSQRSTLILTPAIVLLTQSLLVNAFAQAFHLPQGTVKQLLDKLPTALELNLKAIPVLVDFIAPLRSGLNLQHPKDLRQNRIWPLYVQFVKGAWLLRTFGWTDQALATTGMQHPFNLLTLSRLPYQTTHSASSSVEQRQTLFLSWCNLCDLKRLQERFAARGLSFWVAHTVASQADSMADSWGEIARYFEVSEEDGKMLLDPELLDIQQSAQNALPKVWLCFLDALELVQYLGVAAKNLKPWLANSLTTEVSNDIRLIATAKRGGAEWQKVAPALRNQLRLQQRDALVSYVLGRDYAEDLTNSDALNHHLLVDVEMGTEQKVSRIDLAIASVQTFVQRVLLGYEQDTAATFDPSFETRWEWIKSYQTWRANRELFLYPENWLIPETRDDQSPFFVEFNQALSQRDLTDESVEDAFIAYLQKLDEVARMEIMGTCIEQLESEKVLHIVARTQGIPHQYYHRTWSLDTQHFSSWARLDLDIDGDWVVPIVLNGRLNLYWIKHTKQLESMKDVLGMNPSRPFPLLPHYPIYQDQYTLSWSTRQRRGWTPKRTADHYIARPFFPLAPTHFAVRVDDATRIRIGGVTLPPSLLTPETQSNPKLSYKAWNPRSEINGLKGEVDGLKKKIETLNEEIDSLKRAKETAEQGVRDLSGEVTRLMREVTQLEAAERIAQELKTQAEALAEQLAKEVDSLKIEIARLIEEATKLAQEIDVLQSIKRSVDALKDSLDAVTGVINGVKRSVNIIADVLNKTVGETLQDIDKAINSLSKILEKGLEYACIVERSLKSFPPIETWPQHLVSKTIEGIAQVVSSILKTLWNELKSLSDPEKVLLGSDGDGYNSILSEYLQNHLFKGDSPFFKDDLLNHLQKYSRLDAYKLGWSEPLVGFEFGYFDINEGGAKALRLNLPPGILGMAGSFWGGLGTLGVGAIGAVSGGAGAALALGGLGLALTAEASAMLLYSLFPGYPGLYDVPVLTNLLSFDLPSSNLKPSLKNKDDLLNAWPGSGFLPKWGSFIEPVSYCKVSVNLQKIYDEELAKLQSEDSPFGRELIGLISGLNSGLDTLKQQEKVSLFNTSMRVVRPLLFGSFPGRLHSPLPTIISDERNRRSYLLRYSTTENQWKAIAFYHPLTTTLSRELERHGAEGIYSVSIPESENQIWERNGAFSDSFSAPASIANSVSGECLALTSEAAYSLYNWELLFHIPILLGTRFASRQRFSQALEWYRKVFDPTITQGNTPQRYWRFKKFYDEYEIESVTRWLIQLANSSLAKDAAETTAQQDREDLIKRWQKDPFNPHLIARLRHGAYQRATVMQTIDTLIAWADARFREDTWESTNEATQLYLLARDILGPRPQLVPVQSTQARTYNQLQNDATSLNRDIDAFANTLLTIESAVGNAPASTHEERDPAESVVLLKGISTLYFGIPVNEKLLSYWDTVETRLYNIRHCLTIEGKPRSGFTPNILDFSRGTFKLIAASSTTSQDNERLFILPPYRFQFMLQKANELVGEVKALGSTLLAAIEKRDAEQLTKIRSNQEIKLLDLVTHIRQLQIKEAEESLNAAKQGKVGAEIRRAYYASQEYNNTAEKVKEVLSAVSSGFQIASGIQELAAAILHAAPDVSIGAGGHGNTPNASISYGSSHQANAISATGRAFSLLASVAQTGASMAGTMASYERRQEEWDHQLNLAQNDIEQFEKQIAAAEQRLSIVERELSNHEQQIEHAKAIVSFMLGDPNQTFFALSKEKKFTTLELYEWMISEIAKVYFHSYTLAFDIAKQAEQCFRFELGLAETNYIEFGQFDDLGKGLLAGEKLQYHLRRLEAAYLEKNKRDIELTKHISLRQIDPVALLMLQQTGQCYMTLPESLFDADYPGHYMRRIKSISLTIPCVVGPYTNINCTLSLESAKVRITDQADNTYGQNDESKTRFRSYLVAVQSIATSTAQNDSGLFELNFRDERYLPFEGSGVVSTWRIEMPKDCNTFDFNTISDVIFKLSYTARQGNDSFRDTVRQARNLVNTSKTTQKDLEQLEAIVQPSGFLSMFSAKQEFSAEWHRFLHPQNTDSSSKLNLHLTPHRFPCQFRDRDITINRVDVFLKFKDSQTKDTYASGGQPLGIYLTPPKGNTQGPTPLNSEPLLANTPHGVFAENEWTHVVKDADIWELEVRDDEIGAIASTLWTSVSGHNRLKAEAIDDLLIICHYSVQV
ncbi:neuraminidase-like domain-containing protein [Pantanalinema rosaneae CENA516]|uniref:Tc toxin subunit A-related protein n=1 Tax=Pantanalinema rosaneae TaxID=1620701 RepID=UPI003D6FA1B1